MNKVHITSKSVLIVAFLALAGAGYPASAATHKIIVGFGGTTTFNPSSTNIMQNDTVIWEWQGLNHSTTSDAGSATVWDSGIFNAPHSFTNSFPLVGTFNYHCAPHVLFGMVGSITVTAGNTPPSVTVTNPANGVTLSEIASFTLAASASDNGSVTNVEFFKGASSLGNDSTSPYSVLVSGLGAADYTFSAVASDNTGLKATNSILVHVVTPVPVTLSKPETLSASSFKFDYSVNIGLRYVVQRSTNLFDWSSLVTNTAASNPETYIDGAATLNPGFYRVGRQPNP